MGVWWRGVDWLSGWLVDCLKWGRRPGEWWMGSKWVMCKVNRLAEDWWMGTG